MTIAELIPFIKNQIENDFKIDNTGHDWFHIERVVNLAMQIAVKENADTDLVELAALLHDVGDHKFYAEDNAQEHQVAQIMKRFGASQQQVDDILEIVLSVSYKGALVDTLARTIEAKCVQDADRLDALGAIGVARAFAFGGNRNRAIYDPEVLPIKHETFIAYKNDKSHTINHFYEKLLLLKDRMQTQTGRKLAEEKHAFIELFLSTFLKEWKGV